MRKQIKMYQHISHKKIILKIKILILPLKNKIMINNNINKDNRENKNLKKNMKENRLIKQNKSKSAIIITKLIKI